MRCIFDVCDLVMKKDRILKFKKYYNAEMQVLKSYADLSLEYRNLEKLYDFHFDENKVEYTKCIVKI